MVEPIRYPIVCVSRYVELPAALKLITANTPSTEGVIYAEVGTYTGAYSQVIWDSLRPRSMHLLDLWANTHKAHDNGTTFAQRKDGTTYQVYRAHNMQLVAHNFRSQIRDGRVQLHRGRSEVTIPRLSNASLDIVWIDSMHDYTTPAMELRLVLAKMKPTGLICGHDYTHATGSFHYERVQKQDRGDVFTSYGVIEAVHEFLMFNPAWFLALKTSLTTDRSHTSFCLAQWRHFPHHQHQQIQRICREEHTVETKAIEIQETIDLAVHPPST